MAEHVFEVGENVHVGTYIGVLEIDSQLGVVFSVFPSTRGLPFVLNPASGVITLDAPLDYETTQSYNITVIAASMVRFRFSSLFIHRYMKIIYSII